MASPLAKLDLLVGYGTAFALLGAVQATVVATFALSEWTRPRRPRP